MNQPNGAQHAVLPNVAFPWFHDQPFHHLQKYQFGRNLKPYKIIPVTVYEMDLLPNGVSSISTNDAACFSRTFRRAPNVSSAPYKLK